MNKKKYQIFDIFKVLYYVAQKRRKYLKFVSHFYLFL